MNTEAKPIFELNLVQSRIINLKLPMGYRLILQENDSLVYPDICKKRTKNEVKNKVKL